MPFKSEAQRKYLWANEPEIARDWTDTYGSRIQKEDGGNIRLQPHEPRDLLVGSVGGMGRPKYQPPGGGATSLGSGRDYSSAPSDRGARDAPDRYGPTPTYQTVHDTGAITQTPGRTVTVDPRGDGVVGYLQSLSQKANRRGLRRNLDYYMGGKKLDIPFWAGMLKGPQEEEDYYTQFAGLSPIEMQQRYEGTLSQEDMNRVQHMSSVLGQDKITRKEYEEAFFGPKGPPQPDTGGGEGGEYPWWLYPPGMAGVDISEEEVASADLGEGDYRVPEQYRLADGGRIPAAFGGIMDTYTGRRKYGLGSIFKSITKPIKKVLKSPLGKAALMAGLGYLATPGTAGIFSPQGKGTFWKKLLMGTGGPENLGSFTKGILKNPWVSIPAASIGAGLYTAMKPPEELDDATSKWDEDKAWWDNYYASLGGDYRVPSQYIKSAQGGRIGAQEGGLMDLGGMEKDYRDDGGFVPLGAEEKADDVPARLSKNEFVFTADAVKNAGGGDIDRGAEIMENVMKNLEAGGKVSEESQGQGAEEMFEVSERLSEVV